MERLENRKIYDPKEVAAALFLMGTIPVYINGTEGIVRLGLNDDDQGRFFFSTYSQIYTKNGQREERELQEAHGVSKVAIFMGLNHSLRRELLAIYIEKFGSYNGVK